MPALSSRDQRGDGRRLIAVDLSVPDAVEFDPGADRDEAHHQLIGAHLEREVGGEVALLRDRIGDAER
jgi:hypothetical protein